MSVEVGGDKLNAGRKHLKRSGTTMHVRDGIRGGEGQQRKKDIQTEAFELSVDGYTYREIAKILDLSPTTVTKYVNAEQLLRAKELADRRETEMARRIDRLQRLSRLAEESRGIPGSGALGACGKFEEMINRILGVDAPVKVDTGLDSVLEALISKGQA